MKNAAQIPAFWVARGLAPCAPCARSGLEAPVSVRGTPNPPRRCRVSPVLGMPPLGLLPLRSLRHRVSDRGSVMTNDETSGRQVACLAVALGWRLAQLYDSKELPGPPRN